MTTQLDCSIGLKEESSYGVPVVVDQFLEFTTESLDAGIEFAAPSGARVGARVDRAGRRRITKVAPSGSIELEATSSGLGALLEAVLGAVTNTLVSSGVYQQVHTPATTDYLKSYTLQKGIPTLGGGATTPHTFLGAMCNSIEFSAKAGELVTVATEWMAKDLVTSEAYASPSYASDVQEFSFIDGVLYVGGTITPPTTTALATSSGSPVGNIRDFSVKYENGLDSEGYNIGGQGRRTRKHAVGKAVISGLMTAEYDSVAMRDAYLNNQDLSILLTFTGPEEIATGLYPVLQIVIPLIKINGEVAKYNGGDVITQSLPFVGGDPASAPTKAIYVVYRTLDTTP